MLRVVLFSILFTTHSANSAIHTIHSPNNRINVTVSVAEQILYTVSVDGSRIITESSLGVRLNRAPFLGRDMEIIQTSRNRVDASWTTILAPPKRMKNNYHELIIECQEKRFPGRKLNLIFRVFNDGVAFRYRFPEQILNEPVTITEEHTCFNFSENHLAWIGDNPMVLANYEFNYLPKKLKDIHINSTVGLPLVVQIKDSLFVALTEANLTDWAGMYLSAGERNAGKGVSLRTRLVSSREGQKSHKVHFDLPHDSPWRVLMVGHTPGELIESNMILNLNEPCPLKDTDWIQPGKAVWEWWSGIAPMNTETLKQFIRFAAEFNAPYYLIDAPWYGERNQPDTDITTAIDQIDMPAVLQSANENNVKLWLWMHWKDVDRQYERAFPIYKQWGIAGVKIDFMDHEDQETVNWIHKILKAAAKHHLMVDFHGVYKPTGIRRTWPHLLTREGVLGNEWNRFSYYATPDHNVTIPFTRMLLGPMDYTPGGFLNRAKAKFKQHTPTWTMGTRCHQLAMFVVYDSPLMVLADHPDHYRNQVGFEFITQVPATWHETRVLAGEIGEYIIMARRFGSTWYVGAMSNSQPREIDIPMNFLPEGNYSMVLFSDAEDAAEHADHAVRETAIVNQSTRYKVRLAAGGGCAAILSPQ